MSQKQPNPFIKYSNLTIQMAVIIGLSAWAGNKLDNSYKLSKPIFTIILCLIGIAIALYVALKDFFKSNDK